MRNKALRWFLILVLAAVFMFGAFLSHAENEVPISLEITISSDTKLETAGVVDSILFKLTNHSDEPYTLYHAKLSGGFDEEVRSLNETITVDGYSTREFSLSDVPVADDQLDRDIIFVLTWDELLVHEAIGKDFTAADDTETFEPINETETAEEESDDENQTVDIESDNETEAKSVSDTEQKETINEFIPRSIEATIRIERFVPPELGVSARPSSASVAEGDTFTISYTISNDTKYDISGIMLTDDDVYDGAIPIPTTELMAGTSVSVTIEYEMKDRDMVFQPSVSFIASQKQYESRSEEPVIVGSVITAIKIEVDQYPSNEEGSTFVITVTNIGNRTLLGLQLYDEINTEIDNPFDLAAQKQKVLTFNVPSAYSAGLIRTVRFRITGYDSFGDPFSYTDVNSYDCIPYITSDEVRLSVLASIRNAYYDENGKLCGEILVEIRNYSDVRLTGAILSELTLFGTLETYRELMRGETFYSSVFQLDDVSQLQFCITATDSLGQTYTSEITVLDLAQLASLAVKPQGQQIVYQSNTFLNELTQKVSETFQNTVFAALILVMVSTTICLVLWFLEEKLKSKLPADGLMQIVVPESKTPKTSMDQVLNSSPAEQLGYTVPTKIRYGTTTIKTSTSDPGKLRKFGNDQPIGRRDAALRQEKKRQQLERDSNYIWNRGNDPSSSAFPTDQSIKDSFRSGSPREGRPSDIKRADEEKSLLLDHSAVHSEDTPNETGSVFFEQIEFAQQRRIVDKEEPETIVITDGIQLENASEIEEVYEPATPEGTDSSLFNATNSEGRSIKDDDFSSDLISNDSTIRTESVEENGGGYLQYNIDYDKSPVVIGTEASDSVSGEYVSESKEISSGVINESSTLYSSDDADEEAEKDVRHKTQIRFGMETQDPIPSVAENDEMDFPLCGIQDIESQTVEITDLQTAEPIGSTENAATEKIVASDNRLISKSASSNSVRILDLGMTRERKQKRDSIIRINQERDK